MSDVSNGYTKDIDIPYCSHSDLKMVRNLSCYRVIERNDEFHCCMCTPMCVCVCVCTGMRERERERERESMSKIQRGRENSII